MKPKKATIGLLLLGFTIIVFGIGYFTRYQYFKTSAGYTVRTNRWTEETDVLSSGGWRVVQTHEQFAIDRWMEKHPGEIPEDAKPWVYSHATCFDATEAHCIIYLREDETITNVAAKQWVGKYKTCEHIYDSRETCTVAVPQPPLPPLEPVPLPVR